MCIRDRLLGVEAYRLSPTAETAAFLRSDLSANPYLAAFLRAHEAQVNVCLLYTSVCFAYIMSSHRCLHCLPGSAANLITEYDILRRLNPTDLSRFLPLKERKKPPPARPQESFRGVAGRIWR